MVAYQSNENEESTTGGSENERELIRRGHDRRDFLRSLGVGTLGAIVLPGTASAAENKPHDDDHRDISCATGPFTRTFQSAVRETGSGNSGSVAADMTDGQIANRAMRMGPGVRGNLDAARDLDPSEIPASVESMAPPSLSTSQQPTAIETEFEGIADGIPSDANIAAGPDDLVVAINFIWAIYGKDGTLKDAFDIRSWFANVTNDPRLVFDPWIQYDTDLEQFYLLNAVRDQLGNGLLVLSVSANSDPTGTWYNYAIRPIESDGLVDFPAIGFDREAVYLTQNFFESVDTNDVRFDQVSLTVLDKDELSDGDDVTASIFQDLRNPDGSRAFTVRPTDQPFLGKRDHKRPFYMLNSQFAFGTTLTLWSVTDPIEDPKISCREVPVDPYRFAPAAAQPDTDLRVDTLDARLLTMVYDEFEETVWTAHTIGQDWNGDGGIVAAIRWYEIDPNDAEVVQSGVWGEPGTSYFFPAINTTEAGMQMVYSVSGPETFPRMDVAGRTADFTAGEIEDSTTIQEGQSPYTNTIGARGNLVRWGDYWGVSIDPETETFWSIAQYSPADDDGFVDSYATRVAETSFTCDPDHDNGHHDSPGK